jgi:hypothetical protein
MVLDPETRRAICPCGLTDWPEGMFADLLNNNAPGAVHGRPGA